MSHTQSARGSRVGMGVGSGVGVEVGVIGGTQPSGVPCQVPVVICAVWLLPLCRVRIIDFFAAIRWLFAGQLPVFSCCRCHINVKKIALDHELRVCQFVHTVVPEEWGERGLLFSGGRRIQLCGEESWESQVKGVQMGALVRGRYFNTMGKYFYNSRRSTAICNGNASRVAKKKNNNDIAKYKQTIGSIYRLNTKIPGGSRHPLKIKRASSTLSLAWLALFCIPQRITDLSYPNN